MIVIKNVTEVVLTDVSMTEQIFEEGLSHRKVRKTAMNEASSRSHLVFSIIIDAYNLSTKVQTVGKLSFVDLAGSERSSKTGVDK
jgi:kinesin family protein C1